MYESIKKQLKNKFIFNGELYNREELNKKHRLKAKNDAETALRLIEKKGIEAIEEFDGVFAFAYRDKNNIYLARDLIGIKPLWYSNEKDFAFASEKKFLEKKGFKGIKELKPWNILIYDAKNKRIKIIKRKFFEIKQEIKDIKKIKRELKGLIIKSVKKRISGKKAGVLFSGGIDSTIIAFIMKKSGFEFTCYTAALDEPGIKKAEDLIWAEKVAKELKFKLKIKKTGLRETEEYLKKIIPLIEDNNVVKVGVALPLFLSCEMAKKDRNKVIFSGLGSEEIFAGYQRHEKSPNINRECLAGLKDMHERDLYRDYIVSTYNNLELKVPFLDKELIKYALKIPSEYKIKKEIKKYILREVALDLGIPKEIAFRKKRAAQYGSNFDKALDKLSKKEKMQKSGYLRKFYPNKNMKLGVLYSSGKDSNYALYIMKKQNYEISCLITLKSKNKDSYMFHTPAVDLVKYQAKALEIPLIEAKTKGEKEKELGDLKKAIKTAVEKHKIEGIVTGALFSEYQKSRIEKIAEELNLKVFSPLWHKNQEEEMRELIKNKFKIIFVSVAAEGLDEKWLGKAIEEKDVDKLIELNKKVGINIAGEGGEFESFVLDSPLFKKQIKILKSKRLMESGNTGRLIIEKVELADKI